jgi:hypothetical protein
MNTDTILITYNLKVRVFLGKPRRLGNICRRLEESVFTLGVLRNVGNSLVVYTTLVNTVMNFRFRKVRNIS